jgi:excisionase family DNA binding protein
MTTPVQGELKREWLSYSEAQTLSGLGRTTLWKLVSAGDIEAARVGRAVRISRQSLGEFMRRAAEEQSQEGGTSVEN